jgi:hypothetical protein
LHIDSPPAGPKVRKLAPDRRQPFKRDLLAQVRAIPGVDAAAETGIVPLSGNGSNNDIWMDGQDSSQKKTAIIDLTNH